MKKCLLVGVSVWVILWVVITHNFLYYGKGNNRKVRNQWRTGKEYAGGVATEGGNFIAED